MPPVTRGAQECGIPEDKFAGKGRGRGYRHQNIAGVGQIDQNARVGNNQDNQVDQAMVLQLILECLDNIETNNQILGGGGNVRIPLVQGNNLPLEDDPVARA